MVWKHKHVLSLADFSRADYDNILQTAASFKDVLARPVKKVPALQGRTVANLFFESSTRTRSSFEIAAKRLSADIINFAAAASSLSKGETILDTAKTYLAMGVDTFVIRHQQTGVPHLVAAELDRLGLAVGVLNAGDGQHEHPSQGLLDLFTLCSVLEPENPRSEVLKGKKVTIAGDILHSRVARSNLWSLTACGVSVHLVAPPTLLPTEFGGFCADGDDSRERGEVVVHHELSSALADADFVMALRLQKERMSQHLLPSLREYHQYYGITRDRLSVCKPTVKVLHPGPTNRGVELSSDLMDDADISLVSTQVTNGVAVRMALLYLMSLTS
jgi:aspartate carbamoyltransferase catalytic subunit